jgi:hypothetical protein
MYGYSQPPRSAPAGSTPALSRHRELPILVLYALVSVAFACVYFGMTTPWPPSLFQAYSYRVGDYGSLLPVFKLRILVPTLAGTLADLTHIDLCWIYRGLAVLTTFGLLMAYRRYLSNFLKPGFAAFLPLAVLYPLLWNLCLLNDLYYPFDLPSVLFFTMGCHFIRRRTWWAYYPALALGMLNRETAGFLILVYLFCLQGRIPRIHLLLHLAAQVVIVVGLRSVVAFSTQTPAAWLSSSHLAFNARVLLDMVTLSGNALRDWPKLVLNFGLLWLCIPLIWHETHAFLRRCLLVVIPFLIVVVLRGVIDEMRVYVDLIPIVTTPALCSLAARFNGITAGNT